MGRTAVLACGALALHVKAIAARDGLALDVHPLPPELHNRPERIAPALEALAARLAERYDRIRIGYADCGSRGAVDELADRLGAERLPGDTCYDLFAGAEAIAQLRDEEPGTFFLTDFLVRTFDHLVYRGLGLDRHPELRDDYFGHYRRVVWLAQHRTPELEQAAQAAADRLGLALEIREVGEERLAAALVAARTNGSKGARHAN
jgi:uncharacterized protein DUF1638